MSKNSGFLMSDEELLNKLEAELYKGTTFIDASDTESDSNFILGMYVNSEPVIYSEGGTLRECLENL